MPKGPNRCAKDTSILVTKDHCNFLGNSMKKWLVVLILCSTACTVCGRVGYGFGGFSRNPHTTLQPAWQTPSSRSTHNVLHKMRSPVVHFQNSDILDEARKATDRHRRMGFIRKVYAIVLAQLAYTGASSAWLAHRPDLVQMLAKPLWLGWAMFAFFSSSWALILVEKWRRTAPINIILLALLTVGYSLPVSLVAATIPTSILFPAITQTLLATAAVTVFCLRPDAKHDVPTLRHPLVTASLVHLAMLLIGQLVWAPDFWQNLKATFSLMLFSAYLMHDTASVVGTVDAEGLLDKRDYVYGAVRIYTDMMAMFVQILKLVSSREQKR